MLRSPRIRCQDRLKYYHVVLIWHAGLKKDIFVLCIRSARQRDCLYVGERVTLSTGNPQDSVPDVIILGGGPAGINCALELNETKINFLIIERKNKLGGALAEIPSPIPNVACGWFDNGKTVQDGLCAIAVKAGLKTVIDEEIIDCNLHEKTLRSTTRTYRGRTLFLATGYRLKKLPNNTNFNRFQNDIIYRSGNQQNDFVDKEIVIIGSGESAFYEALERAKTARKVTIVNRSSKYRAGDFLLRQADENERIERIENLEIESLSGDQSLEEAIFRSTTDGTIVKLPVEKLIAKIGYLPNTEIFSGQIDMDASGHIRIGADCATSVNGVFAGGDIVTPGFDRLAVAMGHGVIAAKAIASYLNDCPKSPGLIADRSRVQKTNK